MFPHIRSINFNLLQFALIKGTIDGHPPLLHVPGSVELIHSKFVLMLIIKDPIFNVFILHTQKAIYKIVMQVINGGALSQT